jgi:hypothetical protein
VDLPEAVTAVTLKQPKTPWHAFGPMLPDLVEGNRFLIATGQLLRNTRFYDRYYAMLERKGLIRLMASDKIGYTPSRRGSGLD